MSSTPSFASRAERLFAEYLHLVSCDESVSFQLWVSAYPELEETLRELYEADLQVDATLGERFGPNGAGQDPTHRNGEGIESIDGETWGALEPGAVIGDFRLLQRIGEGGMGQVWEAEQLTLHRTVALKLIHPKHDDARYRKLFKREAKAGASLSHSGIVSVFGAGCADGTHWIAQELVRGGRSVSDLIIEASKAEERPASYYRRTAALVARVADALHAAHDRGVIHLDLKPDNILIGEDGLPKVTDFGLTRILDETVSSQSVFAGGTVRYMSPEQVRESRENLDHRSDVFSLGVVLYELLTQVRPFEGDALEQVCHKVAFVDPPDVRQIRSGIPSELAEITRKALEKDKLRRFQSMSELAAELRRYLSDEPILTKPPSAARRLQKWIRRHPTRAVAFCLASVGLIATISASLWALRKSADARDLAYLVSRLTLFEELRDLEREAQRASLWSIEPSNEPRYREWLSRASLLVESLDSGSESGNADDGLYSLCAQLLNSEESEVLKRLRSWITDAESAGDDLAFASDQDRYLFGQMAELIGRIEAFADPEKGLISGTSRRWGWGVERRLNWCRRVSELTITNADARARWRRAIESIGRPSECPLYEGLTVEPQLGLLPLRRNDFGLWEFVHLASGEEPNWDGEGWLLKPETGIVFVLVPGGRFVMGAQSEDAQRENFDEDAAVQEGPPHRVELSPYFLSKYELTQSQWMRLAGENPSFWSRSHYGADALGLGDLHPVDSVSWDDCHRILNQHRLTLPREAQWEFAARSGAALEVFWEDEERVRRVANVADASAFDTWHWREKWDDGFGVSSPVGSFASNDFGLHDMLGNVMEPCLDGYRHYPDYDYFQSGSIVLDPLGEPSPSETRVLRGGTFMSEAVATRVTFRLNNTRDFVNNAQGVRPARALYP